MKKLQVVCLTYNHEKYIRQALDGFVMQKTSFPFEVLIGDDASTDKTPEIIQEYAKRYPDIIKPFLRKKNLGAQQNSLDLLRRVNAEYLALCEGDDYWTDPQKLQIQVDFLDKHINYNGCWHNAEIVKESNVKEWNTDFYFPADKRGHQYWPNSIVGFKKNRKTFTLFDILDGPIATASIVYRYPKNFEYPEWFGTALAGDRAMHSLMIQDSCFAYINKTMSVYRVSKKGVWFNKNNSENLVSEIKEWVDFIKKLNATMGRKYDKVFQRYLEAYYAENLDQAIDNKMVKLLQFILNENPKLFLKKLKNFKQAKKFSHKIFKRPWISIVSDGTKAKLYLFGIRLLNMKRLYKKDEDEK